MEEICSALKTALVTYLPTYLANYATEQEPLPALNENAVSGGYVDLDLMKMKQCAFIIPGSQELQQVAISEATEATTFDVFVFVRGDKLKRLYQKAMRYGAAIKDMFMQDYSIHGAVGQVTINEMDYFDEVEAEDFCKAIRIGLTIYTELEA